MRYETSAEGHDRYVGRALRRREDRRLLAGRGRYVDDVRLPGMRHAAFVRSNVARGQVRALDIADATSLAGVHAIYTAGDLNDMAGAMWSTMVGPPPELGGDRLYPPLTPLVRDHVRMVGDPLAIVIADSRYVAEDASDLVDVDISPLRPFVDVHQTLSQNDSLVHPERSTNFCAGDEHPVGIADEVDSPEQLVVVRRRFRQARAANVPMESRGLVVLWDAWAEKLTIWSATQSVHEVRAYAARLTRVPENHIRVIAEDVGGGFGQKLAVTREEAAVLLSAMRLPGHPIKWIEDRRENLICAGQARGETIDASLTIDRNGCFLAAAAHFVEDCGAWPVAGTSSSGAMAATLFPGPYRIPTVSTSFSAGYTNTCGRTAYRGPWMMETTAREQLIDHAAHLLGMDPVELRLRNLLRAEDLPYESATQVVYESITPAETLEQALDLLDLTSFRKEQLVAREEGRLVGVGVCVFVEPSAFAFGIMATDEALVRMDPSGHVFVTAGTGNHGQSLETTIPQIVAEHLGCSIEDVIFADGDTDVAPVGAGTAGSRSAVTTGGAAQKAAISLKHRLLLLAGYALEADPEDLVAEAGQVHVRGTPARSVPFARLASMAYTESSSLPPSIETSLQVIERYGPPSLMTWSNATHICTVEVDPETALVKILRYIVSEDCGRIINPMVVEGQIAGGVTQGVGGALLEELAYDADGNPLTTTFVDYLLPTCSDVPDFEIAHIESNSASLGGYKGMGEGGAIGAPAAVANAIHDAVAHLGIHPTELPLSPSRLWAYLQRNPENV